MCNKLMTQLFASNPDLDLIRFWAFHSTVNLFGLFTQLLTFFGRSTQVPYKFL